MDFRLTEQFTNISYLIILVIGLLTLLVRGLAPGFSSLIWLSIKYRHTGTIRSQVARVIPVWLYQFLIYLLESLGGGFIFYRILVLMGRLPITGYETTLLWIGLFALAIFVILLFHAQVFRFWRYILFSEGQGALLGRDYFFLDWIRARLILLLALATLLPIPALSLGLIFLGTIILVQIMTVWGVTRRLKGETGGYLLLFLYLCAHEIIPFLYIIGAGIYLTRSDLLPSLFQ